MPTLIDSPKRIEAAGNKPKLIDEYVGRVNSGTEAVSVAHMRSPDGWVEPGQTPEFDEFTVVLRGTLRVEHRGGTMDGGTPRIISTGDFVMIPAGTPHRYEIAAGDSLRYLTVKVRRTP